MKLRHAGASRKLLYLLAAAFVLVSAGLGALYVSHRLQAQSVLYGKTITQVSTGTYHSLAIDAGGAMYAWGDNYYGELGDPSISTGEDDSYSTVPVSVATAGTPLAGKTIVRVSAGGAFSLALASDGTVYAWGENNYGQLGDGDTSDSNTPVQVQIPDGKTITQVSAGSNFSLALASDGTVYSWGYNGDGRLGATTTAMSSDIPVQVQIPAGKTISQVSSGGTFSLALASDGTVYVWGYNGSGQLGDGTTTSSNIPVQVQIPTGKTITQVSAGLYFSLALASDGTVYSWGDNDDGELGRATDDNYDATPGLVDTSGVLSGKTITQISAGGSDFYTLSGDYVVGAFALVLDSDGSVYSWGTNSVGQLGNDTVSSGTSDSTSKSENPVAVTTNGTPLNGKKVKQISAGGAGASVLDESGSIYSWGTNVFGELGNADIKTGYDENGWPYYSVLPVSVYNSPDLVAPQGVTTTAVPGAVMLKLNPAEANGNSYSIQYKLSTSSDWITASGKTTSSSQSYTISGLSDGQVYDTRVAFVAPDGQVGAYTTLAPVKVPQAESSTTDLSPNIGLTDGGTDVTISNLGFTPVSGISSLSAGGSYSLVLSSGKVYSWGSDSRGELGRDSNSGSTGGLSNTPYDPVQAPVDASGALAGRTITRVSAGSTHALVLDSEGLVYSWGDNTYGQLGRSTTDSMDSAPGEIDFSGVLSGETIKQVSASASSDNIYSPTSAPYSGGAFSLALASDGTVYAWGNNDYGQLGNGTTTSSNIPVQVQIPTGKMITQVSAGASYSLALASDGTVYSWGGNNYSELGRTTGVTYDATPGLVDTSGVLSGKTITQISASRINAGTSIALDSNGAVYAWGTGNAGTLGNGSSAYASLPVKTSIPSGVVIKDISAGGYFALALASDGTFYAWGDNTFAELGTGSARGQNWASGMTYIPVPTGGNTIGDSIKVAFDGVPATNVAVSSESSITATTPAHSRGTVDVVVTNADGKTKTFPQSYTYADTPGQPQSLAAKLDSDQLNISWQAPVDDGGLSISGYIVIYKEHDADNWSLVDTSGTSITVDASAGRDYDVAVAAVNAIGQGQYAFSSSTIGGSTGGNEGSQSPSDGEPNPNTGSSTPSINLTSPNTAAPFGQLDSPSTYFALSGIGIATALTAWWYYGRHSRHAHEHTLK